MAEALQERAIMVTWRPGWWWKSYMIFQNNLLGFWFGKCSHNCPQSMSRTPLVF